MQKRRWYGNRTCYARLVDIDKVRLEHALGCLESFRANFDRSPVW